MARALLHTEVAERSIRSTWTVAVGEPGRPREVVALEIARSNRVSHPISPVQQG